MTKFDQDLLRIDREHIWHPYSAMHNEAPVYPVVSAQGVRLRLADGRELIDGMASWWCAIHGYNHPVLNDAVQAQLAKMAHVMFGGLTHEPAIRLVEKLVAITPEPLSAVFLADSGSVSVEIAMKMAMQYWQAAGQPAKHRFISLRQGYHGDTLAAMSVCDPVNGMHRLFSGALTQQYFVDAPNCRFGGLARDADVDALESVLRQYHASSAALILEPIVQGVGGMRFYSADYLARARQLCDQYGVLLIADEIATGFGRSGRMFACEHAAISPDILCMGKSMTGGYMTLAATLATDHVAATIDGGEPGVFMHGPTFMANPLACAVSLASIGLLESGDWASHVARISRGLQAGLSPCAVLPGVREVRVLGAIGVVVLKEAVDMPSITRQFVEAGVWVRPFGRLVYLMPPYVISDADLSQLCHAVCEVVGA